MCVKDAGNKSSSMFVGQRRYKVAPYRGLWLVDDWIIIVHNKLVWETLFNKLSKNINKIGNNFLILYCGWKGRLIWKKKYGK